MIWRLALGLLVAAAIVVIGLQIRENSGRPKTGPTGPTLILVEPDRTPLPRDSGPENNAPRARSGSANDRTGSSGGRRSSLPGETTSSGGGRSGTARPKRTGRSKARKPPKAHSPPRRPGGQQGGSQPPQTQPQPPPRPPVDVTVPVPARGCIKDVGGVNCP